MTGGFLALVLAACSGGGGGVNSGGADGGTPSPDKQPGPDGACGQAGRSGETACKIWNTTCPTGTYCNPSSGDACSAGCKSDLNCAANQHCVLDSDGTAGSCRTCGEMPGAPASSCAPSPHDDARCVAPGKAFTCKKPSDSPEGSCNVVSGSFGLFCCGGESNPCIRENVQDAACSVGGKAYACPPNGSPPSSCTASHGPPGTYCCPF